MKKPEELVYTKESLPLDEILYGKNLISLGGIAAIDNIFSDINLSGLKLLDVGFGLGGVAYYLAQTNHIEISGIEIHDWMVEHAKAHAPKEIAHLLNFCTYGQSANLPFENDSFDLVYSKGVFNHVKDKKHLFHEIHRVLKPRGQFVIADWIHPIFEINDSSPLVKETKASYENILSNSGFGNIKFRDDSQLFLIYVDNLLNNLAANKEFIEKRYGENIFDIVLNDHQNLIKNIKQANKFAVRITAIKL